MRYANSKQKFLAALLLLISVAGCGGGTKQNGTATRPTVVSAIPPSSGNGACPNTLVMVTFSKAIKASSINGTSFTLSGPGSVAVPPRSRSVCRQHDGMRLGAGAAVLSGRAVVTEPTADHQEIPLCC